MTAHKLIAKIARMTPPGDDADDNALTLARIIDEARSIVAALPQDEIAGLIKLLKITPLYEGSGEQSDLPETAAAAIEALVRERDAALISERNLGNLLARIHRDGGHYQEQNGTLKACVDADLIVSDLLAKADTLAATERELAEARAALANPPKHKFWGAGEPDCPRELKAGSGELHTLRCKVCGISDPQNDICLATLSNGGRDG